MSSWDRKYSLGNIFLDWIVAFFLSTGVVMCLQTSFPAWDSGRSYVVAFSAVISCLFASLIFTVYFSLVPKKSLFSAAVPVLLLLIFLLLHSDLLAGLSIVGNEIAGILSRDFPVHFTFPALPFASDNFSASAGVVLSHTAAFYAFFGICLAAVCAAVIQHGHHPLWILPATAPFFVLCLVSVSTPPDNTAAFMLLIGWVLLFCTYPSRKQGAGADGRAGGLFLILLVIVSFGISWLIPAEEFHRDPKVSVFGLDLNVGSKRQTLTTALLSQKSIDLSSLGDLIHKGEPMLMVEADLPGQFYLRGASLGVYRDNKWSALDPSVFRWNEMYFQWDHGGPMDEKDLAAFSPFFGMTELLEESGAYTAASQLTIKPLENVPNILFTPYFTRRSSMRLMGSSYDSFLYLPLYQQERYSLTYLVPEKTYRQSAEAGQLSSLLTAETQDEELLEERSSFEAYESQAHLSYTSVPAEIRDDLEAFCRLAGVETGMTATESARRLKSYFDANFIYSTDITPLPEEQDFVLHFLNTTQRGYCMHFATAGAMLMRTLGVPTRYVSGFTVTIPEDTQGEFIPVTDRSTHAWIEMWLDGFGWVPFDFTPSLAVAPEDPVSPEESSDPAPSSSDLPSGSSSGTSSSGTSSGVSPVSPEKHTGLNPDLRWVPVAVEILLCLALWILVFCTALRRQKLRRILQMSDTKEGILALWPYMEKLYRYDTEGIPPDITEIAEEACFSRHEMADEQLRTVKERYRTDSIRIYRSLSFGKKILFRIRDALL